MKLGVFSTILSDKPLDEALAYITSLGCTAVELGSGGYPGTAHCNPKELLADSAKLAAFKATLEKYNITVSALSIHGNPVHPDKAQADSYNADFENAVLLAEKIGVDTVVTFSGCPGGSSVDKQPNWVTCPWPPEYLDVLDYQWNEVLIPYWKKAAAFATAHGVKNIALEMHPGFCVYNPETLLRLRDAVGGGIIGANFDPSHLYWQGIKPVAAIRMLGDAVQHFHAKDVKIDPINTDKIGVLDTKHYIDEINRAWVFRTVGYGHDSAEWRDIISTLRLIGYDKVISIEHEDSLMTANEGLEKAVKFLLDQMIAEPRPTTISWA